MNLANMLHYTGAYPEYTGSNLLYPFLKRIRKFPELNESTLEYGIVSAWELDALFELKEVGYARNINISEGPA